VSHRSAICGEGELPQRRRAAVQHGLQQTPPVQLDHTGPGELVRRHRVGGKRDPIQEDHIVAQPAQQHRRRRPCGTGTDYDHIVSTAHIIHDQLLGVRPALRERDGQSWLKACQPGSAVIERR
jgi:hypothetical protein